MGGKARAAMIGSGGNVWNEIRCRGIRKRAWGKFAAEIRNSLKNNRVWLGTFESPEVAARAYDAAARAINGANAKTNFPQRSFIRQEYFPIQMMAQRPASSSLSSTVESFRSPKSVSRPRSSPSKRYPRTPPVLPDDCRSDCDSSSSIVADDADVACSSIRNPLPFDLNLPPPLDETDLNSD